MGENSRIYVFHGKIYLLVSGFCLTYAYFVYVLKVLLNTNKEKRLFSVHFKWCHF